MRIVGRKFSRTDVLSRLREAKWAFYRDPLGIVHLKGLVRSDFGIYGASCHTYYIFVLPTSYRPAATEIAPTLHNDAPARIDIETSGNVSICTPGAWSVDDWFSLDGLSFRAAP